jgi:hypothetical protein
MDPDSDWAPPPFDLSKATKLKDLGFKLYTPGAQWITKTILTAKNLRQISIHLQVSFGGAIAETLVQEWRDLDLLLVQLWTSHSIRPEIKFLYGGEDLRRKFLPELTTKGLLDVIVS